MKPSTKLIIPCLAVAMPLFSHAAAITWGPAAVAIAGAPDIQTAGVTNLEGADFGLTNGTTTTVNNGVGEIGGVDVDFLSLLYTQSVLLPNGITVTPNSFSFNNGAGNGTIGGNYGAILGRHSGVFSNGGTITLSGLVVDTEYQIQIFAMGGDTATVTVSGSPGMAVGGGNNPGNSSGFGKYIVGTFTADATSQVLTLTANTAEPTINALTIGVIGGDPDVAPPDWAATWPQADPLSSTSLTVRAKTTESGTAYYVVLPNGAPAPSAAQVKALTDSSNAPVSASGSLALAANTEATAPVTGLTADTAYDVYFVAEDDVPNLQVSPVKVDVSTPAADTTAPDWIATWPQAEQLAATSITVRAQTNENGTAYYVVLSSGATAPSAAQVQAGTDSANAPATAAGSLALTANVEATAPVTGLTADTAYDVYFVAEDAASNLQANPLPVGVSLVSPAVVTWTGWAAVTDNTQILTDGGYTYDGVNLNGGSTTINNGPGGTGGTDVTFAGTTATGAEPISVTDAVVDPITVSFSGFDFRSTGGGNSNVSSAVGSTVIWGTVLDQVIGDFGSGATATITLSGLSAGTAYTVQFFSSTPDGGINATTTISSGGVDSAAFGSHSGGVTRHIIASFTATSTNQSFSIAGPEPTFSALVIGTESEGGNTFADWIGTFSGLNGLTGFNDDADFDGLDNGLENFLGTPPNVGNAGLAAGTLSGNVFTFTHPQNATPASDVSAPVYTWSTDLVNWNDSDASAAGITVNLDPDTNTPSAGTTTVNATVTVGTVPPRLFVRLEVSQN